MNFQDFKNLIEQLIPQQNLITIAKQLKGYHYDSQNQFQSAFVAKAVELGFLDLQMYQMLSDPVSNYKPTKRGFRGKKLSDLERLEIAFATFVNYLQDRDVRPERDEVYRKMKYDSLMEKLNKCNL